MRAPRTDHEPPITKSFCGTNFQLLLKLVPPQLLMKSVPKVVPISTGYEMWYQFQQGTRYQRWYQFQQET